jgi:cell wall-associated NlpC family hydrolase
MNTRLAIAATLAIAAGALCTGAAGAAVPKAELLPSGRAVAPPSAPPSVRAMIAAADHIRHRPYRWGGGHLHWNSAGYDCSGSVSYVLHAAGLLDYPLDSTGFMRWGGGGPGSWYGSTPTPNTSSR